MQRTDEEIVDAYERWVNRLPKSEQDKAILRCLCAHPKKNSWTARDLIESMRNKKDCFKDMPESLRKMAKARNQDAVEMIDSFPANL